MGSGRRQPCRGPGPGARLSSALVNRVTILNVRVDLREWLIWARANHIRADIQAFINFQLRAGPASPRGAGSVLHPARLGVAFTGAGSG